MKESNKSKKTQRERLREMQREIYLFTNGKYRMTRFLWRVVCYLRKHADLCQETPYRWLYNESIRFLISNSQSRNTDAEDWKIFESWEDWEKKKGWVELFCDLESQHPSEVADPPLTREELEEYLKFRVAVWLTRMKPDMERLKKALCQ